MLYQQTTAFQKIAELQKPLRIIQGGTSASKTIGILQYLIDLAQTHERLTISTVAESLPHLKKGALKDFLSIMQGHGYYVESQHNKTDHVYTFETGTTMEFFGADSGDKVRGPRRDVLFINECNNVPYSVFDQMDVRTRFMTFLDFNPTNEFWVNTEVIPHMEHDFLKLTYKDNEGLEPSIIKKIESRRHNENWWKIFGLGEMGVKEGQIYNGWTQIDRIPKDARLLRHVVDFGYTNDPTAILSIYKWNDSYVFHQVRYQTGLSNPEIAKILKGLEPALTVADSAEPKSIDEIKSHGVRIIGAVKGADSVNNGIQVVQNQRVYITKTSTETIKESRNYLWKTDREGKPLNTPEDVFNHAMDAVRYGMVDILGIGNSKKYNKNRILA